jgi:chromate transporter
MVLWHIFALFTRVAIFSWGGGPASLALMQREVTTAGWVTSAEFADAVALGNALPGPIAPQVSAYVGYRLAGTPGAIAAATGTVLPTTILMLVMVVAFFGVKENRSVAAMITAVRPVVIGLLLWTAYDMARVVFGVGQSGWGRALTARWDGVLLALVAFAVLTFSAISPVWVIIAAALFGFLVYR